MPLLADSCKPARGRMVLVVGPSGVGKDAILDGARSALQNRSDIVFPRRLVTRPPGLAGEDYLSVSEAEFSALEAQGGFALSWAAHGLRYGIRAEIVRDLEAGRQVVVNVSRTVLDDARRKFPGLLVVVIRAAPETLKLRLQKRGRESAEDIEERLRRAARFAVGGDDVVVIDNDNELADAVTAFVALLDNATAR